MTLCRRMLLCLGVVTFICNTGTAVAAGSSTVWRCGQTYQNTPCAPGESGRTIEAADPRDAEQVQAARSAQQADARLASALVKEREARERERKLSPQGGPARIGPAKVPAAAQAALAPMPASPQPCKPNKTKLRCDVEGLLYVPPPTPPGTEAMMPRPQPKR
jgi:hypothetical protein